MGQITFGDKLSFFSEDTAFPGVRKVAGHVKRDIQLVTGHMPEDYTSSGGAENLVIYGTLGRSDILEELEKKGVAVFSGVRGKREVYRFQVLDNPWEGVSHALLIAGSDKRGTIYGLYHLSELLGVSPLVNWNHVYPPKREQVVLTEQVNLTSKEPSVKYRGFFINDEWPAFGTWATSHFGGINAACYERVFELLLRMKGNYLWPAMWSSNFSMDGPGLQSAELADEYGVVMSTSHHEPCMRSGEEYGLLRGPASIYGDAWDFQRNREGITKFWRDGLLRNRDFENVITLGMRGERDSAILGEEATLEDNINLLRDVLKVQNQLIRETVNTRLEEVPRQIVLFTEVEEFFYGNDSVKGLQDDPELDGVTLMLSDNNYGYTRTLPSEEMRGHRGGYGMYYHMDMHGGPMAYEWIGSPYLPRVWEQMTMAYDYGVQEIWVVNVGDIGTQEYGLSYFLDLAYDIEKWGGRDAEITRQYTRAWIKRQFGASFSLEDLETIENIFWDYTGLLVKRKHEAMHAQVYHPLHFGEAEEVLQISQSILDRCSLLKTRCPEEGLSAFISLLYYPACGTANLMKMWILAGRNELYARQNRVEANLLAELVEDCLRKDAGFVAEYHRIDGGRYNGFGLSEHIGFVNWNDEDNKYPICHRIFPASRPRMLAARTQDEHYMTGLFWSDRPQTWRDALRPDVNEIPFELSCGSAEAFTYRIETECPWLSFSKTSGVVDLKEHVILYIHREAFSGRVHGSFRIENIGFGTATVFVEAENDSGVVPDGVFWERDGIVSMEASHFQEKTDTAKGGFRILRPYGRMGSAVKAYPATVDFFDQEERPSVGYTFYMREGGDCRLSFYLAPSTPVVFEGKQFLGYAINEGAVELVNTVAEPEKPFFLSPQWRREAIDSCKLVTVQVRCRSGVNHLRFYAVSPAIVLEKIVLCRADAELPESYLGPNESYRRNAHG